MSDTEIKTRPVKAQPFGGFGPRPRLHPLYVAFVWVIAVIVMFLGQGLGAVIVVKLLGIDLGGLSEPKTLLYFLIFVFGAGALIALLWVRFIENRPLASMGLVGRAALPRFMRGLVMGLIFCAVVVFSIFALGGYDIAAIAPALQSPPALLMIGLLLIGFIVQGSTEEILMRGWVMSAMASRFGLIIAVLVNSTVFAALHLGNEGLDHINWIAMANIVLVGIFLSFYAIREGSLLGVFGWHAAWNWLLGLGFGLEVSGMSVNAPALVVDFDARESVAPWITGGTFGPEGSLIVSLVLTAGIIWFLRPRKQGEGHE